MNWGSGGRGRERGGQRGGGRGRRDYRWRFVLDRVRV